MPTLFLCCKRIPDRAEFLKDGVELALKGDRVTPSMAEPNLRPQAQLVEVGVMPQITRMVLSDDPVGADFTCASWDPIPTAPDLRIGLQARVRTWRSVLADLSRSGEGKLWSIDLFGCESLSLQTHWVLVVMDHCTRRIIGLGIHRGTIDGPSLCSMFQRAIPGQALPQYLSTDHDRLYRFHQWEANLWVLEVMEIKTVAYVPLSHPFVERLVRTLRRECLDRTLFWTTADLEAKLREFQKYFNEQSDAPGVRRPAAGCWRTWVADKFCLVSLAEALSRAVPDTGCRVILWIRHAQVCREAALKKGGSGKLPGFRGVCYGAFVCGTFRE